MAAPTMKRKVAVFLAVGLAAAGWLMAPLTAAAADAWFTPHRGLYRISLASADASSGIVGASGEMYFEWTETCDGWNVNQHTSLVLSSSRDTSSRFSLTFSGWETKDGLKLRFLASHFADGVMVDNVEGEAVLSGPDGAGSVEYSKPRAYSVALPKGTLFPSEYSRRMMARMSAGARSYSALMFDGSSTEGTYEVTTFFATPRMRPPPGAAAARDTAAGDTATRERVWPIRMAYFPLLGGDVEPDFEVGALINGHGVAHRFDIDYGTFVIRAELRVYEAFGPPDC